MAIVPGLQGKSVKGRGFRHIPSLCLPCSGITVTESLEIIPLPIYAEGREGEREGGREDGEEGREGGRKEGREDGEGITEEGRGRRKLLKHNFHNL